MIIKPKSQEPVREFVPRRLLVDFDESDHARKRTFSQAKTVLAKLTGGFEMFVVALEDGSFLPVVMLLPTECTPDIINHLRERGVHVMVGLATGASEIRREK